MPFRIVREDRTGRTTAFLDECLNRLQRWRAWGKADVGRAMQRGLRVGSTGLYILVDS